VKITYDPRRSATAAAAGVLLGGARPTQLNRQGRTTAQYRSAIFPQTRCSALWRKYIAQLDASHAYKKPLVTRIETGKKFYAAESTTRTT
jgi:peptide-methionine (S)-S-oxide reductase